MNFINSILRRAQREDLRFRELDDEKIDVIFFPSKKWPRMGLVLGREALILDYNTSMSFRIQSGNLGFSKDAHAAKCKNPINKKFLENYFLENHDNPHSIQNIMNMIHRGQDVTKATQFPPMLLPKLTGNERNLAIERLVKLARKGDMVFSYHRTDAISAAIRKYDCSPFSHVAIYVGNGEVADIGPAGGEINSLFDSNENTHFALYAFNGDISEENREKIAKFARDLMKKGISFNYRMLFLLFLKKRFKLPIMKRVPSVGDILFANSLHLVTYL